MSVQMHRAIYKIECKNRDVADKLHEELLFESDLKDFVVDCWANGEFYYIETDEPVSLNLTSSEFIEYCKR